MLISLVFESIFEFLTAVCLDRVVILSTSGWSAYDVVHLMLVAPGGHQGVCCHPSLNQPLSGDHWIDLNSWGGFGIIITIVALITINRMLLTDARPSLVQPASIRLSRLLATVARQVRTLSVPPGQNYSLPFFTQQQFLTLANRLWSSVCSVHIATSAPRMFLFASSRFATPCVSRMAYGSFW